jgi:hypothetical protein
VHGFAWVESIDRIFKKSNNNKILQGFVKNSGSGGLLADPDSMNDNDMMLGLDRSDHSTWSDYEYDSTISVSTNNLDEPLIE